jgi:acyl-CoA reductase-like NAD-dependent aldehyde dehydrogenase
MDTTAEQLLARVEQAHHAFEAARASLPSERERWLVAIAERLESSSDELVPLAVAETHLGEPRLRGELVRTAFQLRLLGAEIRGGGPLDVTIDRADPEWGMGPRPDIRRVNEPLGVVGVFGASNFPFAFSVIGGDSASALAAGCSVVHKAHSGHEQLAKRTADAVVEALSSAGAPAGVFALVNGEESGGMLVDHPLVQAVAFTGSTRGGRALFDRAAARSHPIPFYGELGSTNPVFVTRLAWERRGDAILREFVGSVALGTGQFCTKPGFIVVPASRGGKVDRILREAASVMPPSEMLTPRLRKSYGDSLAKLRDRPEIEVITGGAGGDKPVMTLLRTSASTICRAPEILQHEMFGPASVVVEYSDDSELVRVASLLDGQLTTTIQGEVGEDVDDLRRVLSSKSGRVLWNGWPTGVSVTYAQQHGGPYPATTASGTTSVGTSAIRRFMRPVSYQGFPDDQLPEVLRDGNPWMVERRIDGRWSGGRGA